jgi:hypothetical protein
MPVILRESGESMDIKSQKWNSAYAKWTKERDPFDKFRDRSSSQIRGIQRDKQQKKYATAAAASSSA